ncbi:MAG: phosphoribosylformylglycinamidine synthase subunit PurL [Thermoplasmata archaeon]
MMEKIDEKYSIYKIKIREMNEDQLMEISRNFGLALNRDEMLRIRSYFRDLGRDPTDVELQAIGQAWSEHCCYKSSKYVLKKYIIGIDAPQVILVGEDAGVVEFDKNHAYVFKMESHNHPSFVEPYGGAATGVGGIIRDVLCMGAKPLALVDSIFFGRLDFPYEKLHKGTKHPRFLFNGVISCIRDYGNRVGIPTISGLTYFNNSFINNILVNVGCVGVCKKDDIIRSRVTKVNENLVLVGGKTGRDGIHGVTFASKVFSKEENVEKTAVQLGNPIIKEPLIHAVLEAVEKKIVDGMKDLGGGGLSSVVGEMCLAGGVGAEVYLEKVPLKESNMAPWEIWISESQERMMIAVSDENLGELLEIFKNWNLDANVIGRTIKEKVLRLYYHGINVMDLDLHFITSGPVYCRPYKISYPSQRIEDTIPPEPNYREIFDKIISHPNIASKSHVIRQYDHEVKGNTVLKPLNGLIGLETHSDASVIKPLKNSYRGIAITTTSNPLLTNLDPYKGSLSIFDEAIRNLVSSNAIPHSMADNLNLGNPENPVVMGQLYEVARGLGNAAKEWGIPYVSGNVSLYNENEGVSIPPTPTLMAIGIVKDIRKIITTSLKEVDNPIYIINETRREMGGSIYYEILNATSTVVPTVNLSESKSISMKILEAMKKGYVRACHDISEGGLATTLSEMMLGTNMGIYADISNMEFMRSDFKLFSESNTRWVLEIDLSHENDFLDIMKGITLHKIGKVVKDSWLKIIDNNRLLINRDIDTIRSTWGGAFE